MTLISQCKYAQTSFLYFLYIALGTVALCQQLPDSRGNMKLGFVTINRKTIKSRIPEALNVPFCPVTIHRGKSDDNINSLDKILFDSNISLSKLGQGKLSITCVYIICMLAISIFTYS